MAENWWEAAPLAQSSQAWWENAPLANAEPQAPPDPIDQIDFTADRKDVRRAISALPKDRRQEAIRRWQENRVQRERAQARESTLGTIGLNITDTIGQFSRGVPGIGSYADELDAATSAAFGAITSDAPPEAREALLTQLYDENLAYNRARDRAADSEATKLGTAPVIGEVTAGGATKLAGGIAGALVAPVAKVFRGISMLPQIGNYGLTGLLYGALQGFGEGEGSAEDRAETAATGAIVGGGLGAVAAPVAAGAGNALTYLAAQARRTPEALRGYNRGAVRRVAESASADFPEGQISNVVTRDGRRIELGDEATLADMGMNLRQDAGAIAAQPGRGASIIARTLDDRRGGAQDRIVADTNRALGEPVNIPRMSEQMQAEARAQAAPLYDAFHALNIRPSPELNAILQRANNTGVIREARKLMAIEGKPSTSFLRRFSDDYMTPMTGVPREVRDPIPSGLELDYIKRAVDDLARKADRGSNEQRLYAKLAADLRGEVDSILERQPDAVLGSAQGQAPGGTPGLWARAREISGDDISFRQVMEDAQDAFRRGISPDQLEMDLERMTPVQREAFRTGARGNVQDVMGEQASSFGPRGDTAARRLFGSDYNRRRLQMVTDDPAAADQLINRVDAEGVMDATRTQVLQNSLTAARQAAQQRFPSPVAGDRAAAGLRNSSLSGFVAEGAARIANALRGGAINEQRMAVAEDAARMLMAQGATRREIVNALQEYIDGQRMNEDMRRALIEILGRAGIGSASAAASNTTNAQ